MILGAIATLSRDSFEYGPLSRRIVSLTAPGVVAAAFGATFGFWILHQRPVAAPELATPTVVAAAPIPAVNPYGGLVGLGYFSKSEPVSLAKNFTPRVSLELDGVPPTTPIPQLDTSRTVVQMGELAPLPPARPRQFADTTASPARPERQNGTAVVASAPADDRNFLQKLLGLPSASDATPAAARLASVPAAADPRLGGVSSFAQGGFASDPRQSGAFGILKSATASPSARYDQFTAVYDLTAHVLYLPDGRRLEAHSGLGNRLDDPRHVDERMRGATPPHLYVLTPREGSFHGVQALRLNPIGEGAIYGRAGLLAHPFMLGPNGDSNGCVSIREYDAFLQAFQRGQVKRLAVVASLN